MATIKLDDDYRISPAERRATGVRFAKLVKAAQALALEAWRPKALREGRFACVRLTPCVRGAMPGVEIVAVDSVRSMRASLAGVVLSETVVVDPASLLAAAKAIKLGGEVGLADVSAERKTLPTAETLDRLITAPSSAPAAPTMLSAPFLAEAGATFVALGAYATVGTVARGISGPMVLVARDLDPDCNTLGDEVLWMIMPQRPEAHDDLAQHQGLTAPAPAPAPTKTSKTARQTIKDQRAEIEAQATTIAQLRDTLTVARKRASAPILPSQQRTRGEKIAERMERAASQRQHLAGVRHEDELRGLRDQLECSAEARRALESELEEVRSTLASVEEDVRDADSLWEYLQNKLDEAEAATERIAAVLPDRHAVDDLCGDPVTRSHARHEIARVLVDTVL